MTDIEVLCDIILGAKEQIKEGYQIKDHYSGVLCRSMFEAGMKPIEHAGYRFRLAPHKAAGSPSERRKWRALYPSLAHDLLVEKIRKGKVAA